jgi:thiol:disulfide interchange protein DsbG
MMVVMWEMAGIRRGEMMAAMKEGMSGNIRLARRVERGLIRKRLVKVWVLVFCMVLPGLTGVASAANPEPKLRQVPVEVWEALEGASGIVSGGTSGTTPNIQIIFDMNCPWCARLYMALKQKHPDIAVRWVPIAYFRNDSAAMAAAVLASDHPGAGLDVNFRNYDFQRDHGGYKLDRRHAAGSLAPQHGSLKRLWKTWGGYTPMFLFRNREGEIMLTGGAADWVVESVISRAAPPLRRYGE